MRSFTFGAALLAACLNSAPLVAQEPIDAEQVREAIDLAVDYLRREQLASGSWAEAAFYPGAMTSLCTLAMLNAGVPPDDPTIQNALNYLRKFQPEKTYSAALQTMVFAIAEPSNQLLLMRNVKWFEDTQERDGVRKGSWGYPDGGGDNSNTQFALLALHEAERAGVSANQQTWRLAYDYWKRTQNQDGSWGYKPGAHGTGSMTCAGIAAMIITADRISQGDVEVDGDTIQCCGSQVQRTEIQKGINWMGRHFSVHTNPGQFGPPDWLLYYLYGLERVGRLTNQRLIGKNDWYREGAELLVRNQDRLTGIWTGAHFPEDNALLGTSLSLLFLSKGRRPVVVGKLRHEPLDDWNHHRGDIANLTTYTEGKWGRELTWQIVDPTGVSPEELLEAIVQIPVIYISGQLAPEFSDEEVKVLRKYIDRGGFILAESCCGGDDFDRGFRELVVRMFPEPEYQLRLLPPEHMVWSAEEPVPPAHFRPMYGVDVGCRTSVIYCPDNQNDEAGRLSLSCYWELARQGRGYELPERHQARVNASLSIGLNVLAYATNREVKFKLNAVPDMPADGPQDPFERAKLYVAKLKHNGAWNAAPLALPSLMRVLAKEAGLRVGTVERELSIRDESLFDYHLVFMHGRTSFSLSPEEREQLATHLERGGSLFADAVCGSKEFADSFRKEMAAIVPTASLVPIPVTDPLFTTLYGGFELKTVMRRDPHRAGDDGPIQSKAREVEPELEGIRIQDRWAVIFSKYDLSCALERHESLECPGYTRDDAAKIGVNVILYSLHQ